MVFSFKFDDERLEKLKALRANGYEPYGGKFDTDSTALRIKGKFETLENKEVTVAGRIIGRRDHGKIKFFDLMDDSGSIQIYLAENRLDEKSYNLLQYLDVGDTIGVKGAVIKTRVGEISVQASVVTILSKSLLPLPHRWFGLEDTEKRYRKRYLDFIMNPESKEKIKRSSAMVAKVREILANRGFTEVIVPVLQPIPGGANAKPFVTHYNSLDRDFYLKIASELYLKRLIIGGFEKVFDISKNFRNEGVDTRHNPEFMMLELYQAYGDLSTMLEITEEIVRACIFAANNTHKVEFNGKPVDFSKFEIRTMEDAVKEKLGLNSEEEIINKGKKADSKVSSYGEAINALFEEYVSNEIVNPTFITMFPIEVSPLAKSFEKDKRFVYRFELYACGFELANAFSELNDPQEQIDRFNEEASRKEKGIDETQEFDRDFIEAMGYGMPPTGGVGIGIERLQMIGTNSRTIKDVIPFPQLKTIEENQTGSETEEL